MPRTPLLHALSRLADEIGTAEALGLPVEQVREARASRRAEEAARLSRSPLSPGLSRRGFLGGLGLAAGAMIVPRAARAGKPQPRIAIVGGGMAGLTAALELADRGYGSTLFEAQTVGGRVRSEGAAKPGCGNCHGVPFAASATWADGQLTELFGEFIDTQHVTMRRLAARFGLGLVNLAGAEPKGATETYYFFGERFAAADAAAAFTALWPSLQADIKAAGWTTTWDMSNAAGRALDAMSVYDWIEARVPGGHASPFGALLDVAYNIEYGAETRDQSALNLVYLLGGAKHRRLELFGTSNEKYQIQGGNQQLPAAIAAALAGRCELRTQSILTAIAARPGGGYELSFNGQPPFQCDIVLLALPFAALRRVDYSRAGFDARKDRAIRELGAGRNGKIYVQLRSRLWSQPGPWGRGNGDSYADTGYQASWEATRGQPGASGILCGYTGGDVAASMRINHPYGNVYNPSVRADALDFLARIEPVFPGIGAQWNGRAAGSQAYLSRFFGASYAYWRVGQCQTIAGYEGVPQGGVFFTGEHTSIDAQGYMEGAAAEGVRAAKEIAAAIQ